MATPENHANCKHIQRLIEHGKCLLTGNIFYNLYEKNTMKCARKWNANKCDEWEPQEGTESK
jgi:hypothetical protein